MIVATSLGKVGGVGQQLESCPSRFREVRVGVPSLAVGAACRLRLLRWEYSHVGADGTGGWRPLLVFQMEEDITLVLRWLLAASYSALQCLSLMEAPSPSKHVSLSRGLRLSLYFIESS